MTRMNDYLEYYTCADFLEDSSNIKLTIAGSDMLMGVGDDGRSEFLAVTFTGSISNYSEIWNNSSMYYNLNNTNVFYFEDGTILEKGTIPEPY